MASSFEWRRPMGPVFQNRLLSGLVILVTFAILVVLGLQFHSHFDRRPRTQSGRRLFLEYHPVAGQYILELSGLILKNIGAPAFNIEFEPDVCCGHTLLLDNPTKSVDSNPYPIVL